MYDEERLENIRELISDCIFTNNIEIIVQLVYRLELEYKDIAKLATMGEYTNEWTHIDTMNYITYET